MCHGLVCCFVRDLPSIFRHYETAGSRAPEALVDAIKANYRLLLMSISPGKSNPRIAAVDLFCGAGGLSLGLRDSGIPISAGIDLDPACRFPFEKNVCGKFIEHDVADLSGNEIAALFGDAKFRVLCGCAPCQPFSGYTTRRRATDQR